MSQQFNTPLSINDLVAMSNNRFNEIGSNNQKLINTMSLTNLDQKVLEANLSFATFFLNEEIENEQFTFTIANANAAARIVYLFAGEKSGIAAGILTDGAFNDVNAAAGLSGTTGNAENIATILAYLKGLPFAVKKIRVTVGSSNQATQALVQSNYNPLAQNLRDTRMVFTDNILQNVPDQTTFEIQKEVYLSQHDSLKYTILGNQTVSFTFFIGLQFKQSTVFQKLMKLYNSSISASGIQANANSKVSEEVEALRTSPMMIPTIAGLS